MSSAAQGLKSRAPAGPPTGPPTDRSAGPAAQPTQRRAGDPIDAVSDRLCDFINQAHAAGMLLITWHYCGKKDTVLAQLMSVDRLGFWVRCHKHGPYYSEERVNFKAPIDNARKLKDQICVTMFHEASSFKFPAGPLPWVVLGVYALILLIYYEAHGDVPRWLPAEWAEHLPDRALLLYGLAAMFACNAVEGLAICYMCSKRLRMPLRALLGWFLACTFLGYPVACQAMALKRADTQGKLKRL